VICLIILFAVYGIIASVDRYRIRKRRLANTQALKRWLA